MAKVTVFGAGAMGTAMAMHSARLGLETALWATPKDEAVLRALRGEGKHPALPEHLPDGLTVFDSEDLDDATAGCATAIMGANSAGARALSELVKASVMDARFVVSVSKGLESGSLLRISEVYAEELPGAAIVAIGGPCLAAELAEGLPTAAVWASAGRDDAAEASEPFASANYQVQTTDDVVGVEYCAVAKNVAAIGIGLLDGLGTRTHEEYKNAKAALFAKAAHEIAELVVALGGRRETALGLAGVGDILVTSLGGRNRLYGEIVGAGAQPASALSDLASRGVTVEGAESARDVHQLAAAKGLELPYHSAIYRVLAEGAPPESLLEVLC